MPLPEPNPYQFNPKGNEALDSTPLQLRVPKGIRERLRQIPEWQDKLREKLTVWVEQWERDNNK